MQFFLGMLLTFVFGFVIGRCTHTPEVKELEQAEQVVEETNPAVAIRETLPTPTPPPAQTPPTPVPNLASPSPSPDLSVLDTDEPLNSKTSASEAAMEKRFDAPTTTRFPVEHWDRGAVERLEQTKRKRLDGLINRSRPATVMTPDLQGLMGKFEGDILLDDVGQKTWQITMDTDGHITQGKLQGKSLVQLLRNGKAFSTSSNTGNLENIRTTGSRTSFLVRMGDSYYMESFYDAASDSIYGNFYVKGSQGGFRYRGVAQLTRR